MAVSFIATLMIAASIWFMLRQPKAPMAAKSDAGKGNGVSTNNPLYTKEDDDSQPLSLHKLFLSESYGGVSVIKETALYFADSRTTLDTQTAMRYQYQTRTKFMSVYLPASPYTFEAAQYLCVNHESLMKKIEDQVSPTRGSENPFNAIENGSSMPFSGRLFIYHLTNLSFDQAYSLTHLCADRGATLQLRGNDYLALQIALNQTR
jgi:hypothetical protein